MALNKYTCVGCGFMIEAVVSSSDGWARPTCPQCRGEMDWTPEAAPHVDYSLDLTIDLGDEGTHHFKSFHEMRAFEEASAVRARNGEGQRFVFRMLHQGDSNRDVNTLKDEGVQQPSPESFTRKARTRAIDSGEAARLGAQVLD